ncbi:hypothetical protein [Aeromicrobium sp.]|uniref:hypothetical protein n=1 Tax=Aeromicrobium sp. TaxID=1871063 RepID=UPI002FCBC8FB
METDSAIAELKKILDRTAHSIVADGTHSKSRVLQAMAAATRDVSPGAAAALIDWESSEIARLRAFGIVHGVVLRDLPLRAIRQLIGASAHELAA